MEFKRANSYIKQLARVHSPSAFSQFPSATFAIHFRSPSRHRQANTPSYPFFERRPSTRTMSCFLFQPRSEILASELGRSDQRHNLPLTIPRSLNILQMSNHLIDEMENVNNNREPKVFGRHELSSGANAGPTTLYGESKLTGSIPEAVNLDSSGSVSLLASCFV